MAFLDNSGDIILDAVLTDAGRQRMAKGDFSIVKFALADDEINYELYNSSHPSGSAFYDLEIMQNPVLEAFTNNTSTMKSKLMSISRNNILYLPVLKLNEKDQTPGFEQTTHKRVQSGDSQTLFCVLVDKATAADATSNSGTDFALNVPVGCMYGYESEANHSPATQTHILIDQGKETNGAESKTQALESDLLETQYIIQMDHRLGRITSVPGAVQPFSFVDDDDIATYYFGINEGNGIVTRIGYYDAANQDNNPELLASTQITPFNGPLGTKVNFRIRASELLRQSDLLFTEIGGGTGNKKSVVKRTTTGGDGGSASTDFMFIDSIIRVTGVTTGYSIDVPVRFMKK